MAFAAISQTYMRRSAVFCIAVLAILSTVAASAQETNRVRYLSLQDAIKMALEKNLEVQIARFEPQKARDLLDGSYSYYEPTLGFSGRHVEFSRQGRFDPDSGVVTSSSQTSQDLWDVGISGRGPMGGSYSIDARMNHSYGVAGPSTPFDNYNANTGITLEQPLLRDFWIDSGRLSIQLNKKNVKMSELGLEFVLMDIVTRVNEAYYNLIFAIGNVKVRQDALQVSSRQLQENRKRVEVGAMAPLDEKQAEAFEAEARANVILAQAQVEAQENVLKSLITDDYSRWHDMQIIPAEPLVVVERKFDLINSWLKALAQRPDYQQQILALQQEDLRLKYYKNQMFPWLNLIGGYGRSGVSSIGSYEETLGDIRDERNPSFNFGAVLRFPLMRKAEKSNYRISKANREQQELEIKRFEQTITVNLDNAVRDAEAAYQAYQARQQQRSYAESALNAEQKKFEAGKSTSFVVLGLQRDLTSSQANELRTAADYYILLSRIAFFEGSTLDRHNIDLNIR